MPSPDRLSGVSSEEAIKKRHQKAEVIQEVTPTVEANLKLLLDPRRAWEPSLILPAPHTQNFGKIREEARALDDETKIAFLGSWATEEGLPNFTAEISKFGKQDGVGEGDASPWEMWRRGWAAEEDRHGVLMNRYMRDSGQFDDVQVERDVHSYIAAGFNPGLNGDVYEALMYTAWQERATQDSHKGLARVAFQAGSPYLHRAAAVMAGDEGRHAQFYKAAVGKIFELDPQEAMKSFGRLATRGLEMPGARMEGFSPFVEASTLAGVYGPKEYVAILGELVDTWKIKDLSLSGEADQIRDKVVRTQNVLTRRLERRTQPGKSDALQTLEQRWLKK